MDLDDSHFGGLWSRFRHIIQSVADAQTLRDFAQKRAHRAHSNFEQLRGQEGEVDRSSNDWKESITDTYVADINGPHISRTGPLYGLQWVDISAPVVLVEQEFDALAIQDEAGDLCSAFATGYPAGDRRERWRKMLLEAPAVPVAFGTSDEGKEAAETWLSVLPNAHWWPTYIDDRDTRMQPGKQLRDWVEEGTDTAVLGG